MARIADIIISESKYGVPEFLYCPKILFVLSSNRPGAKAVSEAIHSGWIKTAELKSPSSSTILRLLVDTGEAEAIQLAMEQKARLLLIDDRKDKKLQKIVEYM